MNNSAVPRLHEHRRIRCARIAFALALLVAAQLRPAHAKRADKPGDEVTAAREAQAAMVKRLSEASDALERAEKRQTQARTARDDAKKEKQPEATITRLDQDLAIAEANVAWAKAWNDAAAAAIDALRERVAKAEAWQKEDKAADAGKPANVSAAALASKTAADAADAAAVAEEQPRINYLASSQAEQPDLGDALSDKVLILGGLVTLNPYKITKDQTDGKFRLASSNATARGFVQISFSHAWAWLDRRRATRWLGDGYAHDGFMFSCDDEYFGVVNYLVPDDFDIRLGYTFDAGGKNGAAVVGGGDLSSSVSWGHHLYRARLEDDTAVSVSFPAVSLGLVTGRDVLDIHGNSVVGVGVGVGTPVNSNVLRSRGRRVYLMWRAGWSVFEIPKQAKDSGKDEFVVSNDHGFPDFDVVWDGYGNEFEFRVPVGASAFVTATGAFYDNADPNPWTFQLGYTLPVTALADGLASFIGIFGK